MTANVEPSRRLLQSLMTVAMFAAVPEAQTRILHQPLLAYRVDGQCRIVDVEWFVEEDRRVDVDGMLSRTRDEPSLLDGRETDHQLRTVELHRPGEPPARLRCLLSGAGVVVEADIDAEGASAPVQIREGRIEDLGRFVVTVPVYVR